jgi:hypothetical protein
MNGSFEFFQSLTFGEKGEWYMDTGSRLFPEYSPPDRWGCFAYDSIHLFARGIDFLMGLG